MENFCTLILLGAVYFVLSGILFIQWDLYKAKERVDCLLVGDIIVYIVCFPVTLPIFIIQSIIKLFNCRIGRRK